MVKNLPAMQETPGSIPGSGRSPGEENGSPLQIPAWRIPWTEEPGRLHGIHGVAVSGMTEHTQSGDCVAYSCFRRALCSHTWSLLSAALCSGRAESDP